MNIPFLRTLKTAEAEAGAYSEKEVKELWENPAGGEDPVAIIMNRALENAKEFKIQLIMAERERFKLSDSELAKSVNPLIAYWMTKNMQTFKI